MVGIIGKKIGMTRYFTDSGESISATLIEAGPCDVVQRKTEKIDGYNAVQMGFQDIRDKLVNKPSKGHFKKANVAPKRILREFRDFDKEVKVGDKITVDIFNENDTIKVSGYSKGKGFAGVVKRYNFRGGPKTHGQSNRLRTPGSIGQSSDPKRVFKGMHMAGRMGNSRITVSNLRVLKIDTEKNLLLIKGGVPGSRNSIIEVIR
ncbi:MAG: 50S ribosomal protein L3 [bacterium]